MGASDRGTREPPAGGARFIVGIDLGTTNTVAAHVDTAAHAGAAPAVEIFDIEQLIAPGQVAGRPLLPSFRYHAAPGELAPEQVRLPWPGEPDVEPPAVVGEFGRDLGGRVPGRLVSSAKSWLVHPDVDRTAAILPWGAPEDVPKVSPVRASASYLAHVRAAWDTRHPGAPLAEQEVVLTVPASFDDVARQLTVNAAQHAGLPRVRLIEEPQAALYDWLWRHRHELGTRLAGIKLALVCDVGGGTSDFSLVRVELRESGPRLTRTAVGDHLVLGGDNMDLALARLVESRWGARIEAAQLSVLIQQCRAAKERLLQPGAPDRTTVTLLGGGARLIGGARSTDLARGEIEAAVLDGFFPEVGRDAVPARRAAAIREFGLPYVADPAITRHLAGFLARHADPETPLPDALLLNGGVFRSPLLGARLASVLAAWRGAPLTALDNPHPDLAVARGAAAYGLARRGFGLRIGGGSARAYFVIVEGAKRGSREAVCLVPRGVEEGEEVELRDQTFALRLGRPVRFHVASSTTSHYYAAGARLAPDDDTLAELPPLHVVVDAQSAGAGPGTGRRSNASTGAGTSAGTGTGTSAGTGTGTSAGTGTGMSAGTGTGMSAGTGAGTSAGTGTSASPGTGMSAGPGTGMSAGPGTGTSASTGTGTGAGERDIPVRLAGHLTEVGTLELHCVAAEGPARRWALEFLVRDAARAGAARGAVVTELHPAFAAARERVHRAFGRSGGAPGERERDARQLRRDLERLLGGRDTWQTPLLRELFGVLLAGAKRRRRSADHERVWFNLAGWCFRPGYGYPLDDWRAGEAAALLDEGVQYGKEPQVWAEWWTFWRRIAGGLDAAAQERLWESIELHVVRAAGRGGAAPEKAGGKAATRTEMTRLAAALERVAPAKKAAFGAALLRGERTPLTWWALGRVGARVPFHGSAHAVVARGAAETWLEQVLAVDWSAADGAAFAAVLLARRTGDRERDVREELRARVLERLNGGVWPPSWVALVREVRGLDDEDRRLVFGESLPPGLRLLDEL